MPLLYVATHRESKICERQGYQGLNDVDRYWSTDLMWEDLKRSISDKFGKRAMFEPDVVLVTGPVFSLSYSPPWHARFGEIYDLGPLKELKFRRFCNLLEKYWKTNQRFGV